VWDKHVPMYFPVTLYLFLPIFLPLFFEGGLFSRTKNNNKSYYFFSSSSSLYVVVISPAPKNITCVCTLLFFPLTQSIFYFLPILIIRMQSFRFFFFSKKGLFPPNWKNEIEHDVASYSNETGDFLSNQYDGL
jgi:hypothetical protein